MATKTNYKKLYENLKESTNAETDEFNAGYDAAQAGQPISTEPASTPYDHWRMGWVWGDFCKRESPAAYQPCECLQVSPTHAGDWTCATCGFENPAAWGACGNCAVIKMVIP